MATKDNALTSKVLDKLLLDHPGETLGPLDVYDRNHQPTFENEVMYRSSDTNIKSRNYVPLKRRRNLNMKPLAAANHLTATEELHKDVSPW